MDLGARRLFPLVLVFGAFACAELPEADLLQGDGLGRSQQAIFGGEAADLSLSTHASTVSLPADRFCCGDGTAQSPEGSGAVCDGNY